MAAKLTTTISFKECEKHLYDFIKSKRNPSVFIKDLVEAHMNNQVLVNPVMAQQSNQSNLNSSNDFSNNKEEKSEAKMNANQRKVLASIGNMLDDEEEN